MRRLLTTGAGAVLVLGLVGTGAVAQADPKHDDDTLVLYATETASTSISATGVVDPPENDPAAFSAGARFVSVDTLYSDEARTKEAGRNDISCEVTEVVGTAAAPEAVTLLCSGVVRLEAGSLAWQGSTTFAESEEEVEGPVIEVAITGGTGGFRGAGGEVAVFDESEEGDAESLSRYEVDVLTFATKK